MKSFSFAFLTTVVSLVTAAPIEEKRGVVYRPTYLTQHQIDWPHQNTYNTAGSTIFKNFSPVLSTVSTFKNLALSGQTCKLGFTLGGSDTFTGSGKVHVFATNIILPQNNNQGSSGRDAHVGSWVVQVGEANVVVGDPTTFQSFPCPSGDVAWEVVATDGVTVNWDKSRGLYLTTI